MARRDYSIAGWLAWLDIRAGFVVDEEGLPERFAEFGGQRARQDVGRARRREGHHDANRWGRPTALREQRSRQQRGYNEQVAALDGVHGGRFRSGESNHRAQCLARWLMTEKAPKPSMPTLCCTEKTFPPAWGASSAR